MAGDAGTLEVKMVMGLARLQQDVTQAKGIVGKAVADMNQSLDRLKTVVGALGLGVGLAGLASMARDALEAADAMGKLSQKTGIAVGDLSKLKYAADLSGVSTEALAKGVKTLAGHMVDAGDSSSKAAKLFTAMGVSTAGGPMQTIERLAGVFAGLEDGELKTTLATQLFGKAGIDLIPMLNQGTGGLQKLRAEAERLGIVMGGDTTKAAEEFNDNMRAIKASGDRLGISLINELGPAIVRISAAMKSAAEDGGLLKAAWVALGGIASEALGLNAQGAARIRQINDEIARLNKEIRDGEKAGLIVQQALIDGRRPRILQLEAELKVLKDQAAVDAARSAFAGAHATDEGLAGRIRGALIDDKTIDQQRRAWAELSRIWVHSIDEQIANDARLAEAIHKNAADRTKEEKAAIALSAAEWVKKIDGDVKAYETGLLIMAGMQPSMMQLFDQAKERAVGMWTQIGDAAGNFFADLVMNGRSAFDSLKKMLKDLLAQMIALFAKRWILQMAGVAGGATAGSNTLAGGLMDTAGNSLMSTGISAGAAYLFGTSATAVGSGAAAGSVFAGSVATGTVGTAGLVGTGGAMASVYTALAAIPVWGWIAMAVIAAVAWFSGRGGGPKVEGSSVGSFDFAGNDTGAYHVSDEYGNRFLRGTAMDSALDPLRTSTGNTYRNLVGLLGGSFTSAGFGFGASNDPAGDARSRVFGSAMVNGRNVFDGIMDVDDKEVDAALMLTSKRAILAALQATDFDDEIDKIFAGAGDVAKLTGEQIDALIAQAREMYGVIQGIKGLGLTGLDVEALRQFALEGESIGQTFNRVAGAWMQLQESFTSDEVKVQNAHAALSGLFEDLRTAGVDLPTTRDGWLDVMRGLDLSTEAGRALFTQMMNLAPAFDAVATASQAALDEFDQLMGRLRPGYSAGLGQASLSSSLGQFIAGNAWTAGMSPQAVLEALRTITREDFQAYLAHDPTMGRLINTILTLDDTLNGTNTVLTAIAAAGPSGSTIFGGDLSNPNVRPGPTWEWNGSTWVNTATGGGGAGGGGLDEYLKSLLLGSSSTLDPQERLAEAKKQFEDALGGGDSGAIRSAHQAYIDIAQQLFGSTSAFVDIFKTTFDQIAGVGGLDDLNTRLLDIQTRQHQVQLDSYGVLLQIRDDGRRTTEVLAAIVERATNAAPAEAERR